MHVIKRCLIAFACSLTLFPAMPASAAPPQGHAGGMRGNGVCTVSSTKISISGYNEFRSEPSHAAVSWSYSCHSLGGGGGAVPRLFTVRETSSSDNVVRYMTDGRGDKLAYFLCVDPQCSMPVGAGQGNLGAAVHSTGGMSTGTSASGTLLLYVLVPAHQRVPVGDYSDDLSLSIEY